MAHQGVIKAGLDITNELFDEELSTEYYVQEKQMKDPKGPWNSAIFLTTNALCRLFRSKWLPSLQELRKQLILIKNAWRHLITALTVHVPPWRSEVAFRASMFEAVPSTSVRTLCGSAWRRQLSASNCRRALAWPRFRALLWGWNGPGKRRSPEDERGERFREKLVCVSCLGWRSFSSSSFCPPAWRRNSELLSGKHDECVLCVDLHFCRKFFGHET